MKLINSIEQAEQALISADVFFGHGSDNAWDEAVCLILYALEVPLDGDADLEMEVDDAQQASIDALVQQRISSRKPTAYLTGMAWFAGLPFHTEEGVIVPRSHIGGFLLDHGQPWIDSSAVKNVLDLCTGSACIAVAAAVNFPEADVDATDIDATALALAEKNISEHDLDDRVTLIESNIYQNISKKYDLILTNPPYVPAAEINQFPAEYHFEPARAFDGGKDGLDLVHKILAGAADHLTPGGHIVVEVGESWVTLEQAYPKVAFNWVETGVEDSGLFILSKRELASF